MTDSAQVYANLVRSSGMNRHLAECHTAQMMRSRDASDCFPGVPCPGRHLLPVRGVSPNRGVNTSPGLHNPPHERDVFFLDLAIMKLTRQLLMCRVILGDHHDTRCPAVEPMHDSGPHLAGYAAEVLDVVQQGVHQCSGSMARAGVHHHPRRLVQNGDVGVLIQDFERQSLARETRGYSFRKIYAYTIAFPHRQICAG